MADIAMHFIIIILIYIIIISIGTMVLLPSRPNPHFHCIKHSQRLLPNIQFLPILI